MEVQTGFVSGSFGVVDETAPEFRLRPLPKVRPPIMTPATTTTTDHPTGMSEPPAFSAADAGCVMGTGEVRRMAPDRSLANES